MASLFNALPGALSQGLIWGIMAIGLYITYKILDLSDLTVDGSFCTGGAACAMMLAAGYNVWLCLLVAFIAGVLAGFVTGIFHTKFKIPAILNIALAFVHMPIGLITGIPPPTLASKR